MINPDVAGALDGIVDPELGVGIVDLGLVYRATHDAARLSSVC
jgi:metal-sulfur cluster biosynthetic enzyme